MRPYAAWMQFRAWVKALQKREEITKTTLNWFTEGDVGMGTKSIGMVIAVFTCLTICFPMTGHATIVSSVATVVTALPYGSGTTALTVFSLKVGTATTALYFKAPAGREKEMLAVAIAAMTNFRKVRLYKDSTSLGGATPATATVIVGMELK